MFTLLLLFSVKHIIEINDESNHTHDRTAKLLAENKLFSMNNMEGPLTLLKQELVPTFADNKCHFGMKNKYELGEKPHGHGAVHSLLYNSCLALKLRDKFTVKWLGNNRGSIISSIFAILVVIVFLILGVNSIAWYYQSSIALPFVNIMSIFALWLIVILLLTIYASHRVFKVSDDELNNQLNKQSNKVSKVPREIPNLPWYRSPYLQILLAGILPFTAIYIELHFLFMAIFGHQVYTLFGILSLAFIMLLIATCAVTIGLTYFQLQSEDWRWWTSLFTAGSTGIYICIFNIFNHVHQLLHDCKFSSITDILYSQRIKEYEIYAAFA